MQYTLPKLSNDNDFEDLVKDVYIHEFKNPNLQRYGRSGQKQDGIDIVAIAGINHLSDKETVIQCKNHAVGIDNAKLISEINAELKKFDKSKFKDCDYLFVTSADNSKPVIDHCLSLTKKRKTENKPSVTIQFWDYVSSKTMEHREILHKYYSKQFPFLPAELLTLPDEDLKSRNTVRIKLEDLLVEDTLTKFKADVLGACQSNLKVRLGTLDPYRPYMGIFTNPRADFTGMVDFEIDASYFTDGITDLENKYELLKKSLINLIEVIHDPFYSKSLYIRSDLEINIAMLLGRVFRRSGIKLYATFKDMLFTVDGSSLASVPSRIQEQFVQEDISTILAEDCVFIFNSALSTNITNDVVKFIKTWKKPLLLRSYFVNDGTIDNTAHAASIIENVCGKLHNLQFRGVRRIHVFLAIPKPLAMLIGYGLKTLNSDLHLYFMSPDRLTYVCTGILNNRTFGGK